MSHRTSCVNCKAVVTSWSLSLYGSRCLKIIQKSEPSWEKKWRENKKLIYILLGRTESRSCVFQSKREKVAYLKPISSFNILSTASREKRFSSKLSIIIFALLTLNSKARLQSTVISCVRWESPVSSFSSSSLLCFGSPCFRGRSRPCITSSSYKKKHSFNPEK